MPEQYPVGSNLSLREIMARYYGGGAGNYGNQGGDSLLEQLMFMNMGQRGGDNLSGSNSDLEMFLQLLGQNQRQTPLFEDRPPRRTYWHETHPPGGGGGGQMGMGSLMKMIGGGGGGGNAASAYVNAGGQPGAMLGF